MHFSVFVHVVILCALRGALTIQATPFEFTNFSILSDNNKRQFRYDKLFSSSHSLYVQLCIQYKLLMALKVIRNEFNKRWHFCIDASTIAFVKYSALFLVIFEINCIVTWCKRMYYFAVSFFFCYSRQPNVNHTYFHTNSSSNRCARSCANFLFSLVSSLINQKLWL